MQDSYTSIIVSVYMYLGTIEGDALTITMIPGKPTVRFQKIKVRYGSCYRERPHYENTKLTRIQKNWKDQCESCRKDKKNWQWYILLHIHLDCRIFIEN